MSTKPIVTVADLDLMPDDGNRYELIEGEIVVSRTAILRHQRIAGKMYIGLTRYLDTNPIGEVLMTPGVIFDDFNGVIPDLVFVSYALRDEIASGDRIIGAPDLVVEIVSPGIENSRRDRVLKRRVYGHHGVKEYWVVDGETRSIEIYRNVAGILELKTTFGVQDQLYSDLFPGLELSVAGLFNF
jgi:Uma2 family endonuclease